MGVSVDAPAAVTYARRAAERGHLQSAMVLVQVLPRRPVQHNKNSGVVVSTRR
jgi:hypothetical protein